MSKNDDRILELKKQIEAKKKSISERKVRFIPELEVSGLKKEESELKKMESKLDKLLSDDKKTELEIDEIAALLK